MGAVEAYFCDNDGISLRREEVTIKYLNSSSKALSSRLGRAVLRVAYIFPVSNPFFPVTC